MNSRDGRAIRLTRATSAALACLVLLVAPVHASGPTSIVLDVDASHPVGYLTSACGFPVTARVAGTAGVLLFLDESGSVVRETDTLARSTYTLSSPYGSFSFVNAAVFRTTYPSGAALGSPAIVTATGVDTNVPGASTTAGRLVFAHGVVTGTMPGGIPIVDFGPPTTMAGNPVDLAVVIAAACAALAP